MVFFCRLLLVFSASALLTCLSAGPVSSQEQLTGTWHGELPAPGGISLPVVFHFKKTGSGYEGSMDSPAQNVHGIKFGSVTFNSSGTVEAHLGLAGFTGKFSGADTLAGTWMQGGHSAQLTLKHGAPALPKRPQTPQPPFPYRSEEVRFKNSDVILSGTLTLPQGIGPFPGVILLLGSGNHDRDETVFFHKPFLLLSDYLTRRGIAVLRFDKRGCSKSTGNFLTATTEDFGKDALSAFEFLKTRPEIDRMKIGLLGHSEGGTVAAMAAAQARDVRFIVLMAAMGIRGDKISHGQRILLARSQGVPDRVIEESEKAFDNAVEIINSEKDNTLAMEKLKDKNFAPLLTPYFRHFLAFEPAPLWAKVSCPVLALNGERDAQVNADVNLDELKKALHAGGNNEVTTMKLPGLNHLFQTCKSGMPAEYASIEETIAPQVLEVIGSWIQKQTGK